MSAHTPGPWGARKLGAPTFIWQVDSAGMPIAVVTTPQKPFATRGDPARSEANARLIAAAPELLEALRASLSVMERAKKLLQSAGLTMEGGTISDPYNDAMASAALAIRKASDQ